MPDVFHIKVPFLVKFLLKRQDDEHFVDGLADLANAAFFPGPYLRGDIIDNPPVWEMLMGPFGDPHVEAGIVDEDEGIGAISEDILFAKVQVAEDSAKVHQYF